MPDLRNHKAKCRDKWLAKHESTCDPTTLKAPESQRQYLTNRLMTAYEDGFDAGEAAPRERKCVHGELLDGLCNACSDKLGYPHRMVVADGN